MHYHHIFPISVTPLPDPSPTCQLAFVIYSANKRQLSLQSRQQTIICYLSLPVFFASSPSADGHRRSTIGGVKMIRNIEISCSYSRHVIVIFCDKWNDLPAFAFAKELDWKKLCTILITIGTSPILREHITSFPPSFPTSTVPQLNYSSPSREPRLLVLRMDRSACVFRLRPSQQWSESSCIVCVPY